MVANKCGCQAMAWQPQFSCMAVAGLLPGQGSGTGSLGGESGADRGDGQGQRGGGDYRESGQSGCVGVELAVDEAMTSGGMNPPRPPAAPTTPVTEPTA